MKTCNSQYIRMTLQGSKHVVEYKLVNYSRVNVEFVLLGIVFVLVYLVPEKVIYN